jgi:hypothetical protein
LRTLVDDDVAADASSIAYAAPSPRSSKLGRIEVSVCPGINSSLLELAIAATKLLKKTQLGFESP